MPFKQRALQESLSLQDLAYKPAIIPRGRFAGDLSVETLVRQQQFQQRQRRASWQRKSMPALLQLLTPLDNGKFTPKQWEALYARRSDYSPLLQGIIGEINVFSQQAPEGNAIPTSARALRKFRQDEATFLHRVQKVMAALRTDRTNDLGWKQTEYSNAILQLENESLKEILLHYWLAHVSDSSGAHDLENILNEIAGVPAREAHLYRTIRRRKRQSNKNIDIDELLADKKVSPLDPAKVEKRTQWLKRLLENPNFRVRYFALNCLQLLPDDESRLHYMTQPRNLVHLLYANIQYRIQSDSLCSLESDESRLKLLNAMMLEYETQYAFKNLYAQEVYNANALKAAAATRIAEVVLSLQEPALQKQWLQKLLNPKNKIMYAEAGHIIASNLTAILDPSYRDEVLLQLTSNPKFNGHLNNALFHMDEYPDYTPAVQTVIDRYSSTTDKKLIPVLFHALSHFSQYANNYNVLEKLLAIGGEDVIDSAGYAARKIEDPLLRLRFIHNALEYLEDKERIHMWISALGDIKDDRREVSEMQAALIRKLMPIAKESEQKLLGYKISEVQNPEILAKLILEYANHPNPDVRDSIANDIAFSLPDSELFTVVQQLAESPHLEIALACVAVLPKLSNKQQHQEIERRLAHNQLQLKRRVARSFHKWNGEDIPLQSMKQYAQSVDKKVRLVAASSISHLLRDENVEALEILGLLARDEEPVVVEAALKSLEYLEHTNLGAIAQFIPLFIHHPDPNVRGLLTSLVCKLPKKYQRQQNEALSQLTARPDPEYIEALKSNLKHTYLKELPEAVRQVLSITNEEEEEIHFNKQHGDTAKQLVRDINRFEKETGYLSYFFGSELVSGEDNAFKIPAALKLELMAKMVNHQQDVAELNRYRQWMKDIYKQGMENRNAFLNPLNLPNIDVSEKLMEQILSHYAPLVAQLVAYAGPGVALNKVSQYFYHFNDFCERFKSLTQQPMFAEPLAPVLDRLLGRTKESWTIKRQPQPFDVERIIELAVGFASFTENKMAAKQHFTKVIQSWLSTPQADAPQLVHQLGKALLLEILIRFNLPPQELEKLPPDALEGWDYDQLYTLAAYLVNHQYEYQNDTKMQAILLRTLFGRFKQDLHNEDTGTGKVNLKTKNALTMLGVNYNVWFDQYQVTQPLTFIDNSGKRPAPIEAEIRIWDRNPKRDLFQGTYTNSCVGLDMNRPQAIIEALLSTSIQMIEIRNKATQETFGKVLLFWAIDQSTHQTVLVADNVQINKKYRNVKEIRDGFIRYIIQFAEAAKGSGTRVVMGTFANKMVEEDMKPCIKPMVLKPIGFTLNNNDTYYLSAFTEHNENGEALRPHEMSWKSFNKPHKERFYELRDFTSFVTA